jgi:hypothetical protein
MGRRRVGGRGREGGGREGLGGREEDSCITSILEPQMKWSGQNLPVAANCYTCMC